MTSAHELAVLRPLYTRRGGLYFAGAVEPVRLVAVPAPGTPGSRSLLLYARRDDGTTLGPAEVDEILALAEERDRNRDRPTAIVHGQPLLVIGPSSEVHRLAAPAGPWPQQATTPLQCPYHDTPCTAHCALIRVVEEHPSGLCRLICQGQQGTCTLGIMDPEHLDIDVIEALTWGSDLAASRRKR